MTGLVRDLLSLAVGGGGFHVTIWLGITALLLLATVLLATVARRVVDPVCVLVATRPSRVAGWMALSLVLYPAMFLFLVFTIVGIPLAAMLAVVVPVAAGLGYVAAGLVLGDRIARGLAIEVPALAAGIAGVLLLRLLRVVPFHVGAVLTSGVMLFALAAVSALGWDLALSWWRRRQPDEQQFAGEQLIEWDHVTGQGPPQQPPGLDDGAN